MDLSAGMLQLADARTVYDELHEAELVAYLSSQKSRFDLIASADTLCYLGKLEPAFAAAAGALTGKGMLCFTLENSTAGDYQLGVHGRYAHAESYVRQTLADAGFDKTIITRGTLRTEGGLPVEGLVVAAWAKAD